MYHTTSIIQVYNDIDAYLMLDDGIVAMIKFLALRHLDCPHLAAAAKLLLRLDERESMFHRIFEKEVPHGDAHYNLNEVTMLFVLLTRMRIFVEPTDVTRQGAH